MKEYYTELGIPENSSIEEVKKKYKELSKKYHPDLHQNNALEELAKEKFQKINEAYHKIIENLNQKNIADNYIYFTELDFYDPFLKYETSLEESYAYKFSSFFEEFQKLKNKLEFYNKKINLILEKVGNDFIKELNSLLDIRVQRANKIQEFWHNTLNKDRVYIETEEEIERANYIYRFSPIVFEHTVILENRTNILIALLEKTTNTVIERINFLYETEEFRDSLDFHIKHIFMSEQISYYEDLAYMLQKVSFPTFLHVNINSYPEHCYNLIHSLKPWYKTLEFYLSNQLNYENLDTITEKLFNTKISEHIIFKIYQNNVNNEFQKNLDLISEYDKYSSESIEKVSNILFPSIKITKNTIIELSQYLKENKYFEDREYIEYVKLNLNSKIFINLANKDSSKAFLQNIIKNLKEYEDLSIKSCNFLSMNKDSQIYKEIEENRKLLNDLIPSVKNKEEALDIPDYLESCKKLLNNLTKKEISILNIDNSIDNINKYVKLTDDLYANFLLKCNNSLKEEEKEKISYYCQIAKNIIKSINNWEMNIDKKIDKIKEKINNQFGNFFLFLSSFLLGYFLYFFIFEYNSNIYYTTHGKIFNIIFLSFLVFFIALIIKKIKKNHFQKKLDKLELLNKKLKYRLSFMSTLFLLDNYFLKDNPNNKISIKIKEE